MFHVKPYHPTRERTVHNYSQPPDLGFAVVLPAPTLGRGSPDLLALSQLLNKVICSHHLLPTSVALHLPRCPEGLRGWRMKGQGVESPHSLPTQLSNTSSFQRNADLNADLSPRLRIPSFRHFSLENKCFTTVCFPRDPLCIHQGAVSPFAIKSCIFHFSFFPLLCSFFPGFISGDGLWRYG